MVTVRLLMAQSGRDQSWSAGDCYECDATVAARLIAEGRAEPLGPPAPGAETTMQAGAPERAVRPRGKARG